MSGAIDRLLRTRPADEVLPQSAGITVPLGLASAVLAFLATLLIALGLTGARLETVLGAPHSQAATLQIMADGATIEAEARAALDILRQTEGVLSLRIFELEEQRALLEPWLGSDAAVEDLPLPLMIEVMVDPGRLDVARLEAALETGGAPHAIFNDHGALRGQLAGAARGLRVFAVTTLGAVLLALAAVLFLAARATILGSSPAIRTLRLVGARDGWISRIFERRMMRRVLVTSLAGTAAGLVLLSVLPAASQAGFFLIAIAPEGFGWAAPCLIPLLAAALGWLAVRLALRGVIRSWS